MHVPDRKEAAEPFLVLDFHGPAIADQAETDVALKIGNHLRTAARAGRGMIDPEHRFLADRHVAALHQPAIAPQQPHLIGVLLPSIGRLGRDDDRIAVAALRNGDLGQERCGQEENECQKNSGRPDSPLPPAEGQGRHMSASARTATAVVAQGRGGAGRRRFFARSFPQTSVLAWAGQKTVKLRIAKRRVASRCARPRTAGEIIEIGRRGSKTGSPAARNFALGRPEMSKNGRIGSWAFSDFDHF